MKRFLVALGLILILLLMSCGNWDLKKQQITAVTGTVLNKQYIPGGESADRYRIYLYDGNEATWLETDAKTFNKVDTGMINIMLVEKTYFKEDK